MLMKIIVISDCIKQFYFISFLRFRERNQGRADCIFRIIPTAFNLRVF
jgi:hypothetical protein